MALLGAGGVMNRAQILAFNEHNAAIERARRAYYADPNVCANWCVMCVYPTGSSAHCENCKSVRRKHIARAAKRAT